MGHNTLFRLPASIYKNTANAHPFEALRQRYGCANRRDAVFPTGYHGTQTMILQ